MDRERHPYPREGASERAAFLGFYQLFGNFIMEPTGSGQIEIERERESRPF